MWKLFYIVQKSSFRMLWKVAPGPGPIGRAYKRANREHFSGLFGDFVWPKMLQLCGNLFAIILLSCRHSLYMFSGRSPMSLGSYNWPATPFGPSASECRQYVHYILYLISTGNFKVKASMPSGQKRKLTKKWAALT